MKTNWLTRDGELIPINKLTDGHLINCIIFIRRKVEMKVIVPQFFLDRFTSLVEEAKSRGLVPRKDNLLESRDRESADSVLVPDFEP